MKTRKKNIIDTSVLIFPILVLFYVNSLCQNDTTKLKSLFELHPGDFVLVSQYFETNRWDTINPPSLELWWESRYVVKSKKVTVKQGEKDTAYFLIEVFEKHKDTSFTKDYTYYSVAGLEMFEWEPPLITDSKKLTLTVPFETEDTVYGEWYEPSDTSSARTIEYKITWEDIERIFSPEDFGFIKEFFKDCHECVPVIGVRERVYPEERVSDTIFISFRTDGYWTSFGSGALGFVILSPVSSIARISDWRLKGKNKK